MKKLKIKLFAIACIALTSLVTLTTSCSKDDDKVQVQQPNTVTIDGKTESISDTNTYGEIYDGLIYVQVSTKKNESKAGDIFGTYEFEIPFNKVGEKVRIEENMDSNPYYRVSFYEFFLDDEGLYYDRIVRYRNSDTGFLTGTNNWVQFKKDSKLENTYTVDFEINLEGKVIKGNYTGVFEVYN
jgi:hypothetical protein